MATKHIYLKLPHFKIKTFLYLIIINVFIMSALIVCTRMHTHTHMRVDRQFLLNSLHLLCLLFVLQTPALFGTYVPAYNLTVNDTHIFRVPAFGTSGMIFQSCILLYRNISYILYSMTIQCPSGKSEPKPTPPKKNN